MQESSVKIAPDPIDIFLIFCQSPPPCVTNIPLRQESFLGKIFSPVTSLACRLKLFRSQRELEKILNTLFRTVLLYHEDPRVETNLETCSSHLLHLKRQIRSNEPLIQLINRILELIITEHISLHLTK
jgi:hypothetical protein